LTHTTVEPKTCGVLRRALLVLLVACRGGSGDAAPPCSAAAARFLDIARRDLATAGVDDATSRAVRDQLPAMRDALAAACTDGNWSAALRKCLVRANDHGDFETCEQQLTDEQRRDLDRATRGTAGSP
jgi:hypothetical protein